MCQFGNAGSIHESQKLFENCLSGIQWKFPSPYELLNSAVSIKDYVAFNCRVIHEWRVDRGLEVAVTA